MNRHGRGPSANPRTERKQLLLTKAELAAQLAAAAAEGKTWSAWIVRAAAIAIVVERNARNVRERHASKRAAAPTNPE